MSALERRTFITNCRKLQLSTLPIFCTNLFFCLKPILPIFTRRFSFPFPYVVSHFPNHLLRFSLTNLWKTPAGCNFRKIAKCHLTHPLSLNRSLAQNYFLVGEFQFSLSISPPPIFSSENRLISCYLSRF